MVAEKHKPRSPYAERLAHAMSLPQNRIGPVELAQLMELSRQAIEKLLRGSSIEMSASNNAKAARILNVDPTWLALGVGLPEPDEFIVRWHERAMIELYRELPPREQDEFADSLRARYAIHKSHEASTAKALGRAKGHQ